MSDQLEFKISEGLIRPIIEAKINLAVAEAMGGHERIVVSMLDAYMKQKVDSEGKNSNYSDARNRLDWLLHRMIEDSLKVAMTNYLQTKTEMLEKEFEKFFASKKGTSQIVAAMQDGFCKALADRWKVKIAFEPSAT
jgi:hypothetical protein